jgi:hypothetical protein
MSEQEMFDFFMSDPKYKQQLVNFYQTSFTPMAKCGKKKTSPASTAACQSAAIFGFQRRTPVPHGTVYETVTHVAEIPQHVLDMIRTDTLEEGVGEELPWGPSSPTGAKHRMKKSPMFKLPHRRR